MKRGFGAILVVVIAVFFVSCTDPSAEPTVEEVPVVEPSVTKNEQAGDTEPIEDTVEEPVEEPTEDPAPPEQTEEKEPEVKELPEKEPEKSLVNGKTGEERIEEAIKDLHKEDSADYIRENFPDIELVFTHNPSNYPKNILPFEYFYSAEVDKTFNLCGIDRTVFICDGKWDKEPTDEELNEHCTVTPVYLE